MGDENNEQAVITRVKYYRGQALTAQDFKDEQLYHSKKLQLLLQRFPSGIIRDLEVTVSEGKLEIGRGIGVNKNGDLLAIFKDQTVYMDGQNKMKVGEKLEIPLVSLPGFENKSKIYVNLSPVWNENTKINSLCDSLAKPNRVEETVNITFDPTPDGPAGKTDSDKYITIAVLVVDENGKLIKESSSVVTSAGIMDEDQIQFKGSEGHDHSGGVNGTPIKFSNIEVDKDIKETKITFDAEGGHDHSGGTKGKTIKFSDIDSSEGICEFKVLFNGEAGHDHSGDRNGKQIDTASISDGSVSSDKIALAPFDGTQSDSDSAGGTGIRTSHIRNYSVTENKIADGAITTNKISNGSITAEKLDVSTGITPGGSAGGDLTGNYPAPVIKNGAVTTQKILDNAVTTGKINDSAVTSIKISANAVTTDKINDNAVTEEKIGSGAVTLEKIANSAITDEKIGSGAVTVDKISSGAVTGEKIAVQAVKLEHLISDIKIPESYVSFNESNGHNHSGGASGQKIDSAGINNNAVSSDHIAAASTTGSGADTNGGTGIRTSHLRNSAVSSDKIALAGSERADTQGGNGIRTSHIRNGAVSPEKLNIIDIFDDAARPGLEFSLTNGNYIFRASVATNAQLQVIPSSAGSLSFTISSISYQDEDYLLYGGSLVVTQSTSDPVLVTIRTICFGSTKDQSIKDVSIYKQELN